MDKEKTTFSNYFFVCLFNFPQSIGEHLKLEIPFVLIIVGKND